MNKIKKLSIMLVALVMCVVLGVTAWAAEDSNADFSALLSGESTLHVSGEKRTVTVTVAAKAPVSIFSLDAAIIIPDDWSATVSSGLTGFTAEENYGDGRAAWYTGANVSATELLVITYTVPAGATGTFELGVKDLELGQLSGSGWNVVAQDVTASTTLTIEDHDYRHSVAYEWAADNSKCTATGTCICEDTDTVTVDTTKTEKIPATCTAKGTNTYTTQAFGVYWATTQTKDVEEIAQLDHSYTGEIKNDGDTHSFKCVNGCNAYGASSDHDFTNGDCACGAEKPVVSTGLKGDIDLDGVVGPTDLTALAKHLAEIEFITDEVAVMNADVTGNGEIGPEDLTKFAQYMAEIIDSLD